MDQCRGERLSVGSIYYSIESVVTFPPARYTDGRTTYDSSTALALCIARKNKMTFFRHLFFILTTHYVESYKCVELEEENSAHS